jgi:hypothetical protein
MDNFNTGTGFSIELVGWQLEPRGEYEGLPLYESTGGKITAIAIVKNPAIQQNTMGNESDKTITGPVMIPDQKIFRNTGPNGQSENCYWYFSKETIAELRKTFTGEIKMGH